MDDLKELVMRAWAVRDRAYAPYSSFRVGAAVRMDSGAVYEGVNVENASYPAGACAERNAIAAAVAAGERRVTALAVCGGRQGVPPRYCFPCGICRQVLREFGEPETCRVAVARTPDDYRVYTLAELLPESFGPSALGQTGENGRKQLLFT